MAKHEDNIWRDIATHVLLALVLLSLLLNIFLSPPRGSRGSGYLYIYALDVGQSDATLVTTGGKTLLIDSGTATSREALLQELSCYGVEKIDVLLLTHPHEDHIGNARYLVEYFEVGEVLLPPAQSDELAWQLLLQSVGKAASVLEAGDTFSLGLAEFEVLSARVAHDSEDENDASVVLRGVFGNQVLLFMGDAGAATEQALLDTYGEAYLDCDYLKVGHHGSKSATSMDFLLATTPVAASISCGAGNIYGFPHEEVLERLAALGTTVARTDRGGTAVFGTNGREMRRIKNAKGGLVS